MVLGWECRGLTDSAGDGSCVEVPHPAVGYVLKRTFSGCLLQTLCTCKAIRFDGDPLTFPPPSPNDPSVRVASSHRRRLMHNRHAGRSCRKWMEYERKSLPRLARPFLPLFLYFY